MLMPLSTGRSSSSPLWTVLADIRRPLVVCGCLSLVVNLLMLASPLFMLQVYDRVLTSRSLPTLLTLSGLLAGVFLAATILDILKGRILNRAAALVVTGLGSNVFSAVIDEELAKEQSPGNQPLLDLQTLRQFATGPGLSVVFDMPWTPVYLVLAFVIHPVIGLLSLVAMIALIGLAVLTERSTSGASMRAAASLANSHRLFEGARHGAEVLRAMGLERTLNQRWHEVFSAGHAILVTTSDRAASIHMSSKYLRLFLQSAVLAVGAGLAIKGEVSAGSIIAASIIMARALQPVEQATGQWAQLHAVRSAIRRLSVILSRRREPASVMPLPAPKGALRVEAAAIATPGQLTSFVSRIDFELAAGEMLAIVGPTGSGKSTLARALAGIWPTLSGDIRLDGSRLDTWPRRQLAAAIGYVPQDVELFAGTIADNIARFEPNADAQAIVKAAQRANVHDMILRLPNGYMTQIGEGGTKLSGGQRQRIALARALFGDARLIILDEPNANLDEAGETALVAALDEVRGEGVTVIVISHRGPVLSKVDKILVLNNGVQAAFGPRGEILKPVLRPQVNPLRTRGTPVNLEATARAE